MKSDRIRERIEKRLLGMTPGEWDNLELMVDTARTARVKTKQAICEVVAEYVYPQGIARIAEVYHPNGLIS